MFENLADLWKFLSKTLLESGIKKISDLVSLAAPDELQQKQIDAMKNYLPLLYAALKTYGQDWVASTETDIDDALVDEAIEICELFADKYGVELNAKEL